MADPKELRLRRLKDSLPDKVSRLGDPRYDEATAIWSKSTHLPQAVVHARTAGDVQAAIRCAHDADLPLSVRGGGHDWAGRALCDGLVIDLRAMNQVSFPQGNGSTARIGGGARAMDVAAAADPFGIAVAAGQVGIVGMGGFTTGGGYGGLIGRCGLALDNLVSAEVVLADGRVVTIDQRHEPDLFWAIRGGGGNFGVVTMMEHRTHELPSVHSGMLLYPFSEAKAVLDRYAAICAAAPDALTVQVGMAFGPDGAPFVYAIPTWCGRPEEGEAKLLPCLQAGTVLGGALGTMPYGASLTFFDAFLVNGHQALLETCWIPALEGAAIDRFIAALANAPSRGCAMITHEFRGAAARVPETATAFGLRRNHVLIEILAVCPPDASVAEYQRHSTWARSARESFGEIALPGGYTNLMAPGDQRAKDSYGPNAARLMEVKRHYDPDNLFRSAIPLPRIL